MVRIKDIAAREIFDSRGNPTIETTLFLDEGTIATAAVPSGASKGTYEALELRDNDKSRFAGLGILKALKNIEEKIKPSLLGMDVTCQKDIDRRMIAADGTVNKSNFGANSILSVSLASARAAAKALHLPLFRYLKNLFGLKSDFKSVTPIFNVINGGLHGGNRLTFQEFFIIPDLTLAFPASLREGVELYHSLKRLLQNKNLSISVGDEGGFAPYLSANHEALELLQELIGQSDFQNISLGLDLAASSFYKNNTYQLTEYEKPLEREKFMDYLVELKDEFALFLLEDPLFEDDWEGWSQLNQKLGATTIIVGDDLLVTNPERLKKATHLCACNAILVKVNQIGTLTEALEVVVQARQSGFKIIISHRSGETNDDFISDLAVGVGADFVKFGAPARGERVAKYNRLLEIYQELEGR